MLGQSGEMPTYMKKYVVHQSCRKLYTLVHLGLPVFARTKIHDIWISWTLPNTVEPRRDVLSNAMAAREDAKYRITTNLTLLFPLLR